MFKNVRRKLKVIEILLLLLIVGGFIMNPPKSIGDWIFAGLMAFCLAMNLMTSIVEKRKFSFL